MHKNIVCLPDFKLVAEEKRCTGSETYQGVLENIELCYSACKVKASMRRSHENMFIYGLALSRCYCETSSENGKCIGTMEDHPGYNLYAYEGEIGIRGGSWDL